jgi:hypothetical protein
MEEHDAQYLLPQKLLKVLSSGVAVPLVDDNHRSTPAIKMAKA